MLRPAPRRPRHAVAAVLLSLALAACQDSQGPAKDQPDPTPELTSLVLSRLGSSAAVDVSLPSGTLPSAVRVVIQNRNTADQVTTAMASGGFDPVAIPASAGDTLDLRFTVAPSGDIVAYIALVPQKFPPVIVSTSPPPKKRDVPLNSVMILVFSEPIDPASITSASLRLQLGGQLVPGTAQFTDTTGMVVTFSPAGPLAPTADYTLYATQAIQDLDGEPLAMPVAVPFTTAPMNIPPAAGFTVSCSLLACTFTNASTDADGTIVAYDWDFGDSIHASTPDASHTYAVAGQYAVTLQVTDNIGAMASYTVWVTATLSGIPPSANFTGTCAYKTCIFTNNSTDADGTIVAYDWDFGDHSAHSTVRDATHIYTAAGQYTVKLVVTDNDGLMGTSILSITASDTTVPPPYDYPPVAAFSVSCIGLDCSFTDRSYDPGGAVVSVQWTFGDGQGSSQRSPQHTYAVAGSYTVWLTVTDDAGQTASASQTLTVPIPTVDFTVSCTGPVCTFQSNYSWDPFAQFFWDFGDGGRSTLPNPTHTYTVSQPTTFTVVLSLWESQFGGGIASHDITVGP